MSESHDLTASTAPAGPLPLPAPTLAARREALVALCASQRTQFRAHYHELTAPPPGATGSGWRERLRALLAGNLKVPLAIASAAVGIASLRKGGAMSLVGKALALWKIVGPALALLRRGPA